MRGSGVWNGRRTSRWPGLWLPALLLGCAALPAPQAVVFEGDCPPCTASVVTALRQDPERRWQVRVVRGEVARALGQAELFVMPGGNEALEDTWNRLTPADREAVDAFVRGGGRYLGLCLGAYLTGEFGEGEEAVGWRWLGGVGAYAGPWQGDVMEALVETTWDRAGSPERRWMYFSEGTRFGAAPPGSAVLARYVNGDVAALVSPVGRGAVGVVGPHPEADADWYDAAAMNDTDGYDTDLLHHLLDTLLRLAAPG